MMMKALVLVLLLLVGPAWATNEPVCDQLPNHGCLSQNETITGNWVNTAYPWADDEVSDTLTCSDVIGFTEGSVPFADSGGTLVEDSGGLFQYIDAYNQLWVNRDTPPAFATTTGGVHANRILMSISDGNDANLVALSYNGDAQCLLYSANGSEASPTATLEDERLGQLRFSGRDDYKWSTGGHIEFRADQDFEAQCVGGTAAGDPCTDETDCPGGACTGGDFGSRMEIWIAPSSSELSNSAAMTKVLVCDAGGPGAQAVCSVLGNVTIGNNTANDFSLDFDDDGGSMHTLLWDYSEQGFTLTEKLGINTQDVEEDLLYTPAGANLAVKGDSDAATNEIVGLNLGFGSRMGVGYFAQCDAASCQTTPNIGLVGTICNSGSGVEAAFKANSAKQFSVFGNSLFVGDDASNGDRTFAFKLLAGNEEFKWNNTAGQFEVSDDMSIAGDMSVEGGDLFVAPNTDGMVLVADGTNFNPVQVSGDVEIDNTGATAIQADVVGDAEIDWGAGAGQVSCADISMADCGSITASGLDCSGCISGGASGDIAASTITYNNIAYGCTIGNNPTMSAGQVCLGASGLVFEGAAADDYEALLKWDTASVSEYSLSLPTGLTAPDTLVANLKSATLSNKTLSSPIIDLKDSASAPVTDGRIEYDSTVERLQVGDDGVATHEFYPGDQGLKTTDSPTFAGITCTDCITLSTETAGNYVASATASQGLTMTGTEGGSLGLQTCTDGQILKNSGGTSWGCASGAGSNSFETIDAPAGTDPVADSSTDTLTITAGSGSGLTVTGNSTTDTLDFKLTNNSNDNSIPLWDQDTTSWVLRYFTDNFTVSGTTVDLNSNVSLFGSYVNAAEMATEDFGAFSCDSTSGGCTIDGGTECKSFDVSELRCATNDGCFGPANTDGTYFNYGWTFFASDTDDVGTIRFVVPKNITGTTATVRIFWFSTNATYCDDSATADVCWTVDSDSFGAGDDWQSGQLLGTEVGTSSRCTDENDLVVTSPMTLTHSLEAGELAVLKLRRDTDETIGSCSDDLAANAFLLSVEFCYTTDGPYSGE